MALTEFIHTVRFSNEPGYLTKTLRAIIWCQHNLTDHQWDLSAEKNEFRFCCQDDAVWFNLSCGGEFVT